MHLLKEDPKIEVVGLCFEIHYESEIRVKNLVTMTNLDNSAVSFSLDYEVLFREIQLHEKKGERLVGIFHSHPGGARIYPSHRDLHFMRYWPYPYLWLIGNSGIGESNPELAIYTLLNEKIIEIPYLIAAT